MMDEKIFKLLTAVKDGKITIEKAYGAFQDLPYEDLHHSKVDHHRMMRKGLQEVIFGEGKTLGQIIEIIASMRKRKDDVLVTRIAAPSGKALCKKFPGGIYNETARCFSIRSKTTIKEGKGPVLIISAGTSDIPVAEEAYVTSLFFGNETEKLYDVGVAGIHRLFGNLDILKKAKVIIVAAGMEGALPSIVAGIVGVPVLAVPTSVGYGASFGGLTALLGMLNSCSTVSVFNIDNGFGAAYFATLINKL
jgi:pyridinium-3,5-biscarboxylic acid mononucleotide synthase